MAFVKIKKAGKGILSVPSGSLDNYIRSGWKLLEGSTNDSDEKSINTKAETTEAQNEQPGASGDHSSDSKDEWDEVEAEEESEERSVDEMSLQELQAKAKELGINTKNLNTVGALRKAIKKAQ
jgi:protein required for attachment to host cells